MAPEIGSMVRADIAESYGRGALIRKSKIFSNLEDLKTPALAPEPVYLFGPFAFHATKRLLLRGNQVVKLTSKALETLLALVQSASRILEKDELLRRVGPEAVVEEANLTQAVFMLRRALGERIKDHRYIVTVPKRGGSRTPTCSRG